MELWKKIQDEGSVKLTLQDKILNFILTNKGLTRKELSQKLSIKIGSINGSIVRLKKKKLIREVNSRLFPE